MVSLEDRSWAGSRTEPSTVAKMSHRRPHRAPADRSASGRASAAIRDLPVLLQVALALLVALVLVGPFVITAAIGSITSSPSGTEQVPPPGRGEADAGPDEEGRAGERVADTTWTVIHVVDGDTLDVRGSDGSEHRIRVIGIDTPERGECGYTEASDALAGLVLGERVVLNAGAGATRDRYGRLLRYVDLEAGVADREGMSTGNRQSTGRATSDVGLVLLDLGLAIARYDSRDGYGEHPREDTYVAADAAAASPVCEP
jgi:endonuclease YncB( thermonuclease family)